MVLESLMSANKAEKQPWEVFFLGVLYASIGAFLGLFLFGTAEASLVMVFLTVLASTVLMYTTLRVEEEEDEEEASEVKLLRHHAKAITFFIFLFLGFVVAFSLWFLFLPETASTKLFSSQMATIHAINGAATMPSAFSMIVSNNLRVLAFAILFSFFYGLGAIFVLTWNASVIGAAVGTFARNLLHTAAEKVGSVTVANYFTAVSVGLGRYLVHGVPEIAAYFVGGLAGGIISVALMRNRGQVKRVLKDSGVLLAIAIALIFLAAWMEVFVTPALFKGL